MEKHLPIPLCKPEISTLDFLNAVLYVVENGCKWRALAKEFGNWHVIYVRFNDWCKKGVWQRVFFALCLGSTTIKVHPDASGALKKRQTSHRTVKRRTDDKNLLNFSLSGGNCRDAPEGQKLLERVYSNDKHLLLMDRAYGGDETRNLAITNGFISVVPPKSNRKEPWEYDKKLYKK